MASTYTAMFSADLMPCTLTLPLISLALTALTNASIRPAATAVLTAILPRLMTFLSCSNFTCRSTYWKLFSLEHVINAGHKGIWMEELCGACRRIEERLPPLMLVFANDLHVGTDKNLEARAEAVPRVVLRDAVEKVRRRIHEVIPHVPDQPRVDPVVGAGKPA